MENKRRDAHSSPGSYRLYKVIFILSGILILSATSGYAQANTYRIESTGDYQQSVLEQAMDRANFDSYRKNASEVVLPFDKGAKVVLLSGQELQRRGIPGDQTRYLAEEATVNDQRTFTIHSSGVIMELVRVDYGK